MARIHPTALVDPGAHLGSDVVIEPYALIGPGVIIEDGVTIGPRVTIERATTVGAGCTIGAGAVLGSAPQDLKDAGRPTRVEVGEETVVREYATINRGVIRDTVVGPRSYIMMYAHVAHDCRLGEGVILGNAVQCAGHVLIEDYANIGGLTPVHQFVRIGTRAFIGGGSRVPQDVPPFALAAGNPLRLYGVNVEGLRRAGFTAERRLSLKRAFRTLFNSTMSREQAMAMVSEEFAGVPEIVHLVDFLTGTERGVLV